MAQSTHSESADPQRPSRARSPRWTLLATYGLGVLNDHAYQMIAALLAVQTAVQAGTGSTNLVLVSALFTVPLLGCAGAAGQRVTAYNARTVLIVAKACEVLSMGLGAMALLSGRFDALLVVVGLLGLRAAWVHPAAYGLASAVAPARDPVRPHALLDTVASLAMILGTALGTVLYVVWQGHLVWTGGVLLAVAGIGAYSSLRLPKLPPAGMPARRGVTWREMIRSMRRLAQERLYGLTVLGLACFWLLVALLHMAVLLLGAEVMRLEALRVGGLVSCLPLGLGLGRYMGARLAGARVELGLVPLGAFGLGSSMLLLSTLTSSYGLVACMLVCLGASGALFSMPLQALLDAKSPAAERAAILAVTHVLSLSAILLASAVLWIAHDLLGLQAHHVIALAGLGPWLGTLYVLRLLPEFVIRLACWMLTHTLYRIRVVGAEHIPRQGPALLVCNHVSYVDGLLVAACVRRFIRFLIYRPIYEAPALHWLFRLMHAIPIAGGPGAAAALAQARQALQEGHVVCIFAEGAITRTGNLLPFKRGFEHIIAGLHVPVIPMHLDQLWGSLWSFQGGRARWKWPRHLPRPVTVSFAPPLPATATAPQVRQTVMELGSAAMLARPQTTATLPRRFIATAKQHWSKRCVADTRAPHLTYGQTLVHSLLLANWLQRHWPQTQHLGIYGPTSATAALLHVASTLAGKAPIMLETQWSPEAVHTVLQRYGLDLVLTARHAQPVPSLPSGITAMDIDTILADTPWWRCLGLTLLARWLPTALVQRLWTATAPSTDALATVVSTAEEPVLGQGVMLSHRNILASIEGLQQVLPLRRQDCLMGVLPLSHALGALATLWFPLLSGCGVVYHADATEAHTVGELVGRYQATLLVATPTMYAAYLDACPAAAFASLRYAVSGTEPLEATLAEAFQAKYGLALVAGYGCAEMGAIVSLNITDVHYGAHRQLGSKPGTVGQPLPGVAVRIVDPSTGEPVPPQTVGALWLYGPHRMLGYWGQPAQTAQAFQQGWYVTGDLASLDEDGFLCVVGRISGSRHSII